MPDPTALPLWLQTALSDHREDFDAVDLASGDALFAQNDAPDALYVVREGTLDVLVQGAAGPKVVAQVEAGGVVGEMGLLTGQPRTAGVRAAAPTRLWRLPREAFERLRHESPALDRALAQEAVPRWQRVLLTTAFQRLFGSSIDVSALHDLQQRVLWRTLESGEAVCRQGDEGNSMYIIVSGRVLFEVERPDGSTFVVGEAGAGEAVGEFALMTDAPRSASVVAVRQTSYVEIGRELFTELVAAHPAILFSLTRQLAERQRRAHTHGSASLAPPTLTVTLMPTHDGLDVRPLAEALVAELNRTGRARLICKEAAERALGEGTAETRQGDPLHAVMVQWLNEQEAEAETLVFLADADWSPWSARCISRSDSVFFVARTDADPAPSAAERRLADSGSRADRRLVLWHPPSTEAPSHTLRWLEPRPGYTHYHVREGDGAHVARLARHITGTAVGLVLGGGGARGYAHVGLFRVLEEAGVPVDYVGGASFGALIGAKRATEMPTSQLLLECADFADNRRLFDRTLPVVAMNASHRLTAACQALYGDQQIEDLWVPYFAMAVNLTRGESVVIERGPVWLAVRKSIAVPGIFSPVVEDGELFVDGGVLNNFPVDVMVRKSGSDRVIGARIAAGGTTPREYDMLTGHSGWRGLWRQINPFARSLRLPTLSRVLTRTLFVGSAPLSDLNSTRTDVTVVLDIHAGLLDFEPYEEIAATGYEQSREPILEWVARQPDLARTPSARRAAA
ncbi:cyclic nucleotide-binding domain-containing protein [Rubricoccus marinus]|uniref:PNPLA domain-containing protein n=1 Tax=Rubricoccus marinus TaxID=716817 RepID=A0A259TWB1_9BACT|nr:cyclic nucleotide-binding domain-containing protein [Rubricoccus marinus]OZC02059.1 hypothetical protein BSZ36_03110 [Rubricoccus marinus]